MSDSLETGLLGSCWIQSRRLYVLLTAGASEGLYSLNFLADTGSSTVAMKGPRVSSGLEQRVAWACAGVATHRAEPAMCPRARPSREGSARRASLFSRRSSGLTAQGRPQRERCLLYT